VYREGVVRERERERGGHEISSISSSDVTGRRRFEAKFVLKFGVCKEVIYAIPEKEAE